MRHSKRSVSNATGQLIRGTQSDLVRIEDVSLEGVKLSGVKNLAVDEVVKIHSKGCIFFVRIVWTQGVTCGAQFQLDTGRDEIARFLRAVLGTEKNRLRFDSTFHELSSAKRTR
jgi:hypothetical protein